jgi:hypothetical protein
VFNWEEVILNEDTTFEEQPVEIMIIEEKLPEDE